MKKTAFIIMTMAFSLGLMARPVDVETAKQLGGSFMAAQNRAITALTLVETEKTVSGLEVCYVFNCQPKGFVIVAADDRMRPILGYSTESSFHLVAVEEGPEVFFDAYRCDLMAAVEQGLEPSSEVVRQWRMLAEAGRLPNRSESTVEPLCASTWHQTQLYNDQCPEDPEGYNGHVKSGCVANAMAQIMRYWEWPKTGVGSHSYYCYGYGSTSYGTLSANFGEADYRYELMPDFLDYTSPQYQVDAVALLEYHAGVSVEMSYGPSASGAYSFDAIDAFQQYFRYSPLTDFEDRYYYSDDQWVELMKNELDNGRPMYYSAYSNTKDGTRGGHAFVCDGYDEYDFFHFNWGWQGFDNGFYSINGMDLTYHAYNYDHYATTDLEPNDDYYEQPMPVGDLEIEPWAYGMAATLTMTAPSHTLGDSPLSSIDSIVVLMNGEILHVFEHPQPGEPLEFGKFFDNADCGVVNYFTVYPVTSGGRGKAITRPVELWTSYGGMSTPLTFYLHDAAGDGWLSPAISIVDERGVVQHRIGLEAGYEDTVTVNIPVDCYLTLFWNYCNVGYEDDDAECSFEVYDYRGELLFEQTSKPEVGALFTFYSDFDVVVAPDYITAEYVYREDGTFGVQVSWDLDPINQWFGHFVLERYLDLDANPVAEWSFGPGVKAYFDEVAPGTYYYRLSAEYGAGGGIPVQSGFAPNLLDPSLDYAMVEVTEVPEFFEETLSEVTVFNALGQLIYSGETTSMHSDTWRPGTYLLRYTTPNGKTLTKKYLKL